jgi:hypothetical protein
MLVIYFIYIVGAMAASVVVDPKSTESTLPSVVPQHDSYCVADGFTGKGISTCSNGNPYITETDLLNNGHSFSVTDYKYKSSQSSSIVTSSPIRASYLALGTANSVTEFPELLYSGSTVDNQADGISLDNRGQRAFDYLDSQHTNDIVNILIKRIETIISLGANAIRFDELDTCTNEKCFENFSRVMTGVFEYMANHTVAAIGNNNSNLFVGHLSFAKLLVQSKVDIVGWIVESGQTKDNLYTLYQTIGSRVPIFGICRQGDCSTYEGTSYTIISIFKSISYYDY